MNVIILQDFVVRITKCFSNAQIKFKNSDFIPLYSSLLSVSLKVFIRSVIAGACKKSKHIPFFSEANLL